MAQNGGEKEDKFDAFTAEGESLGYISLEQARVLAMRHARDNKDFYGPAYSRINLVWEVISQEEGEDYYDVRLSFRPSGRFRGEPGVEQFIIDKTGSIEIHQILDEPTGLGQPSRGRPRLLLPSVVGLVVAAVVAVAALFGSGVLGGGEEDKGPQTPIAAATATPASRPAPTDVPTSTPVPTRQLVNDPTPTLANPGTVSLTQLKQILLDEIRSAAPSLSADIVDELVSGALAEAQSTGRISFNDVEVKEYLSLALSKLPEGNPPAPEALVSAPLLTVAVSGVNDSSILPWNRSAEGLILLRPMFEYLLELDANGQIMPMLAEQWEVEQAGRRWTFSLRKGVPFHFGWGEVTAKDVLHSFKMLTQDLSRARSNSQWREVVRNVRVLDDYTVEFMLNRPVQDFIQWVSSQGEFMIVSKVDLFVKTPRQPGARWG